MRRQAMPPSGIMRIEHFAPSQDVLCSQAGKIRNKQGAKESASYECGQDKVVCDVLLQRGRKNVVGLEQRDNDFVDGVVCRASDLETTDTTPVTRMYYTLD